MSTAPTLGPPPRPHARPAGLDLNYLWMPALMRLLCSLVLGDLADVAGIENVPRHGGLLIVSNHVGTVDPPFLGAYLPRGDVYFMTKSEYFHNPLIRFFIVGYHGFPVVRGTADRAALRQALNLIGGGHAVVVYPEGHRSADGRLQRPQPGAGFLARAARVPVLPGRGLGHRAGTGQGRPMAAPGAGAPSRRAGGPRALRGPVRTPPLQPGCRRPADAADRRAASPGAEDLDGRADFAAAPPPAA